MNVITTRQLRGGDWCVAHVMAVQISARRTGKGSLRIFHTPSFAEAAHIARMWHAGDFSREPGGLRHFNPERTPCDTA